MLWKWIRVYDTNSGAFVCHYCFMCSLPHLHMWVWKLTSAFQSVRSHPLCTSTIAECILSHDNKRWSTAYFFFQPLGMIFHHSCLLTGPGLLSKQTSPEHNLNAQHLAFSNCWCAAVDCCHQKLLVSKLRDVWGPHCLIRLWNYVVFIMKWRKKDVVCKKTAKVHTSVSRKEIRREKRHTAFTDARCLSGLRPALRSTNHYHRLK